MIKNEELINILDETKHLRGTTDDCPEYYKEHSLDDFIKNIEK